MVKMLILHGDAAGQVVEMYPSEAESAGAFGYATRAAEPKAPEPEPEVKVRAKVK